MRLSLYASKRDKKRTVFKPGDLIQITGRIREPDGRRNPGCFDYKAYLLRQGIQNVMSASSSNVVLLQKGTKFNFNRVLSGIRDRSVKFINEAAGGEEADLLNGMLLGTRWLISQETGDSFTKTGLSHILAISGLNVGFIILLVVKLTNLLRLNKTAAFVLSTVIMVAFCMLVGSTSSVVRAAIMSIVFLGGKALGRRSDVLNSAGVAALIMLMYNPLYLYDAGFQLSFVTVASIALLYKPVHDRIARLPALPPWAASVISVTIAAQIGALPLIMYHFNNISAVSLLTNLIAVPLSGFIVTAGFLLLALGLILPFNIAFLGFILKLPCTLLLRGSILAAGLPFASVNVISPPVILIVTYFLVVLILSPERPAFIKKPFKWAYCITGTVLVATLFIIIIRPTPLKVVFLDVGQGDCIYIRTPGNRHILIDSGGDMLNPENSQTGRRIIVPFLLKHGIAKLDLVIVSHNHDDHIGGMPYLLNEFKVDALMVVPPAKETDTYKRMMSTAKSKSIEVIKPYRGQSYLIDEKTEIRVLFPMRDEGQLKALSRDNENNRSLVLELKYDDTGILFTGDMEAVVENYITPELSDNVDIIKVPHHGSKTSSSEGFIDAVSSKTAVIQVGENFYGHPNIEVLERYKKNGVAVFRNDLNGAVTCIYKNGEWNVDTMLP